jgi:hypothetical protein
MALEPPRTQIEEGGQEPPPARAARPLWQAVLLFGGGLIVFFLVVGFALRTWVVPAMSGASSQPSPAQATLAALQTQEAVRPVATAVVAAAPAQTPAPAAAPVLVPAAAPTSPPRTAAQASATSVPTAEPTAMPTVPPDLAADVSQAYLQYFQVSSDALRSLNPAGLDSVATGDELQFLLNEIQQDRAAGRALDTSVQHSFVVVSAGGDQAEVADDYRDSSIFVDPSTGVPLPGQVRPTSPQTAPEAKELYHLHRELSGDGQVVWKVEKVDRYE